MVAAGCCRWRRIKALSGGCDVHRVCTVARDTFARNGDPANLQDDCARRLDKRLARVFETTRPLTIGWPSTYHRAMTLPQALQPLSATAPALPDPFDTAALLPYTLLVRELVRLLEIGRAHV